MKNNNSAGQALVAAILLLAMLAITIPTVVWWTREDTKGSVREKKSTTAFHQAEAAVDRALWLLESDPTIWTSLASGTTAGFRFDNVYSDVPGGSYAIYLSSDASSTSQRYVIGVGRDNSTKEVRAIKIVYSKPTIGHQAAYGAQSDYFTMGGVQMHWGPIYSKTYIDVGTTTRRYPRKYSATRITPDPPYCGSASCQHSGVSALTDNKEYWAYTSIPAQSTIDLTALKGQATAQNKYSASSQSWNNKVDISGDPATCVYYINGNLDIQGNTKVWCNIIATGYIHIQNGASTYTYDFTPPPNAYLEYQQFDTNAVGQYPGDAGSQTVNSTFRFGQVGCVTPQTCTTDSIAVHGFMYAGTDIETQDTFVVLGSLYQAGAGGQHMQLSGTFKVYYDPAVIDTIPVVGGSMTRVSWNEIPGSWPANLH